MRRPIRNPSTKQRKTTIGQNLRAWKKYYGRHVQLIFFRGKPVLLQFDHILTPHIHLSGFRCAEVKYNYRTFDQCVTTALHGTHASALSTLRRYAYSLNSCASPRTKSC